MNADPGNLYAFPRNLVLAASAGTGKTHALVGVVVHLLVLDRPPTGGTGAGPAEPVDPSRIVATTFSRKAAAEIRSRITQEVERLSTTPSSSVYHPSLVAAARAQGVDLADQAIRTRAARALRRLPSARLGTLHSFATGIVRAHAIELGLGPGFELANEADARSRSEEAIGRSLERCLRSEPVVVRALVDAAGGVDRLVGQLRRILVQLEEDGRPARDMLLPEGDASTIEHSLRALVDHARALQELPKYAAAAQWLIGAWGRGDEQAIEAACAAICAVPATGKKTSSLEAFAVYRRTLPGLTNEEKGRRLARLFRNRHRFADHARIVRDVLDAAERDIEAESRANAAIGFGEILRAARELLRDRPDVAAEVSGEIDALLVDEFQDTSRVQRDLVQLLWARADAREAGTVPPLSAIRDAGLLVVGDRKQSIYGFRGADVGVFAELAVGLAGAPAREALGIPPGVTWEPRYPSADFHALRHNRRSAPGILAFANVFSARRFRPGDPPPELFEIAYVPATEDLLVPPERLAGIEGSAALQACTTWLRVRPKGASSTRLEEALVIAERIASLVAAGETHVGEAIRTVRWRDVAVLATTNGMLDATAFALAQAEIPYVVAGKSFFRTREVRDLLAMLALVLDPSDRLAALEVLRGPWVGVHDATLLGLVRPGRGLVPPHAWGDAAHAELVRSEDRAALDATARLIQDLSRTAARLGAGEILREAARARGLEELLAALPRGEQRVANVRKLLAIADRHNDARAFRKWLVDASEQELAESEAATFSEDDDAVRLLTVHASKGLDFPIVFVPEIGAPLPRSDKGAARIALGASDAPNGLAVRAADAAGLVLEPPSFANAYALTRRRERAERQRLAYVAVTRAADAMFLVGGRNREGTGDLGAATLFVLEEIAGDPQLLAAAAMVVEDVEVPSAPRRSETASPATNLAMLQPREVVTPQWRSLPIAPTALADFDHCARRFELVHVLGLPEHMRGARSTEARPAAMALDSRVQGTLAHAVLERVPTSAFAGADADAAASRALVAEGVPAEHPQHATIVGRVVRFLRGSYAQSIAEEGGELLREVPFILPIEDAEGRAIVLRGSMDLVVVWRDGSVDIVDYKSARAGADGAYGFQLDVYALAARTMFPAAPKLRAGLVYLGGASAGSEPTWRILADASEVRARLGELGDRVVRARWTGAFPRVALARCESIHCGFIGRCHGSALPDEEEAKGTDAKPSDDTTM